VTRIIEKDISWLHERVPDFHLVVTEFAHVFNNGGYLAGGALRAFINNGSIANSYQSTQRNTYFMAREPIGFGDIDFFFYNQIRCKLALSLQYKKYMTGLPPANPNSMAGYAFEIYSTSLFSTNNKHQFIYSNYGKPWNILDGFDIANCKIATDGKKVWMVEGWEELEKNKTFRIDRPEAKFLVSRMHKYFNKNPDYKLDTESSDSLLFAMLKFENGMNKGVIARILRMPIFDPKLILMFYGKLGLYRKAKNDEDYAQGIITSQDYAVRLYEERTGLQ
jgi:hypothetical protein